jgi:LmbE family N-acetylglucosaminyl deacetylase
LSEGGLSGLTAAGRLLVVSPHLDDAVFSCGGVIQRAPEVVVLSVFAGSPPGDAALVYWDAACGFVPGDDVMAARRDEDREALRRLGATTIWGDEQQQSYRTTEPPKEALVKVVTDAIGEVRPSHVLLPLGFCHEDHILVGEAARAALKDTDVEGVFLYGDQPYVFRRPLMARRKLAELATQGFRLERLHAPWRLRHSPPAAIGVYASQLKGLHISPYRAALLKQRYWQLRWT